MSTATLGGPRKRGKNKSAIAKQKCRICGCTEADCSQCIAKTGGPCHWVRQDLCSACAPDPSGGELKVVPRESVFPSERNSRRKFNREKLEELAASFRGVGILQPIVVRKAKANIILGKGQAARSLPTYEIVAGERRWCAAKIAGMEEVPVLVRSLDELQAAELRMVENLQRENLSAMEEARGYEELGKLGLSVDQMAQKIGKSRNYVYACLKLLDLPVDATKALDQGSITRSHAERIARVPSADMQASALNYAMTGASLKSLETWIAENCCLQLKGAPFSMSLTGMVKNNGGVSCNDCPKRTGNNPLLQSGAGGAFRGDVCTDPACYHAKEAKALDVIDAAKKRNISASPPDPKASSEALAKINGDAIAHFKEIKNESSRRKEAVDMMLLQALDVAENLATSPRTARALALLAADSAGEKCLSVVSKRHGGKSVAKLIELAEKPACVALAAELLLLKGLERWMNGDGNNLEKPVVEALGLLDVSAEDFLGAKCAEVKAAKR